MRKAVQQRTLETRARLVAVAHELIAQGSYESLRIEEIVLRAGVAKGTFFAHFVDKDSLMDLLIGERIDALLDQAQARTPPANADQVVERLLPLLDFMTSERYVFDVMLRRSGAAAHEDIGPIALSLGRMTGIVAQWLTKGRFRTDVPADVLAEGVEAFVVQVVALNFCALHNQTGLRSRLKTYLRAWLNAPAPASGG